MDRRVSFRAVKQMPSSRFPLFTAQRQLLYESQSWAITRLAAQSFFQRQDVRRLWKGRKKSLPVQGRISFREGWIPWKLNSMVFRDEMVGRGRWCSSGQTNDREMVSSPVNGIGSHSIRKLSHGGHEITEHHRTVLPPLPKSWLLIPQHFHRPLQASLEALPRNKIALASGNFSPTTATSRVLRSEFRPSAHLIGHPTPSHRQCLSSPQAVIKNAESTLNRETFGRCTKK